MENLKFEKSPYRKSAYYARLENGKIAYTFKHFEALGRWWWAIIDTLEDVYNEDICWEACETLSDAKYYLNK
jgi:hypothetical protein